MLAINCEGRVDGCQLRGKTIPMPYSWDITFDEDMEAAAIGSMTRLGTCFINDQP
jgi:hypothetical protein